MNLQQRDIITRVNNNPDETPDETACFFGITIDDVYAALFNEAIRILTAQQIPFYHGANDNDLHSSFS